MKKIIILIITIIVSIGIGYVGGFYTKVIMDKNDIIREKEKQSSLSALLSQSEIEQLKATIEKDEADYGDSYEKFRKDVYAYKKDPDRIYFKSSKVGAFYVFEKDDENFEHLLEVVEDRMHYSIIDDFNLNCFTPDSIDTMMMSGENYIILDYDNENLSGINEGYNKDIIFKFLENTRLYRLATYLSYYKEPISKNNLPKKEFADNTSVTGYQYMIQKNGD